MYHIFSPQCYKTEVSHFFSPMAGLYTSLRPQLPSSAASATSLHSSTSKLLLRLTVLPLTLAFCAFVLQWRGGGVDDPISRWSPEESHKFPGMDSSPLATVGAHSSQSSDCSSLLGHANTASFPYYRDWKFNFQADLKPKVDSFSNFFFRSVSGVLWSWLISNGFCLFFQFQVILMLNDSNVLLFKNPVCYYCLLL